MKVDNKAKRNQTEELNKRLFNDDDEKTLFEKKGTTKDAKPDIMT